jgi:coiled-coil domain-containing protein 22
MVRILSLPPLSSLSLTFSTCLDEIKSISQLGPAALVEIVARSLWLISQGEVKFPIALPTNIASKHRICTNMATKIKEMGYLGDCGYNQLLYPVDTQTRALLNWLVQKLPRTEVCSLPHSLA